MSVEPLLAGSRDKLMAALELLFASVEAYSGFDPQRTYTPQEREPFDALSDCYLRAFESSLKFFRTWERMREAAPSESFRDLLLRMEKLGFISDAGRWLQLRDVRNRIAHEGICPASWKKSTWRSSVRGIRKCGGWHRRFWTPCPKRTIYEKSHYRA